jgi:Glyoxalase-like domain
MPDVAFKDLCIDVTAGDGRPAAVAAFWSVALEQPINDHHGEGFSLDPPAGGEKNRVVWFCEVPEKISTKSRAHIDIRVADGDPAPLLALGGTLERSKGGDINWHILNDPDGVALCVFDAHPEAPDAFGAFELNVDAVDAPAIAAWWAERTDGTVKSREEESWVWIENAAGFPYMFWVFGNVPEPKTVKNRVHWDVRLVDTTIEGLIAAGATLLRPKDDDIHWWVMADPEGNEFCAFE